MQYKQPKSQSVFNYLSLIYTNTWFGKQAFQSPSFVSGADFTQVLCGHGEEIILTWLSLILTFVFPSLPDISTSISKFKGYIHSFSWNLITTVKSSLLLEYIVKNENITKKTTTKKMKTSSNFIALSFSLICY